MSSATVNCAPVNGKPPLFALVVASGAEALTPATPPAVVGLAAPATPPLVPWPEDGAAFPDDGALLDGALLLGGVTVRKQ